MPDDRLSFLSRLHPYDELPEEVLRDIAQTADWVEIAEGDDIYRFGETLSGLYIIFTGKVSVTDQNGTPVSLLEYENSFGERGLLRDGLAATSAKAVVDTRLIRIPADLFETLRSDHEVYRRFFDRTGPVSTKAHAKSSDLSSLRVDKLMIAPPLTCSPDLAVVNAARQMRDSQVSCLCVVEAEALAGIVTVRDLSGRALADNLPHDTPVSKVMTPNPQCFASIGHRIGCASHDDGTPSGPPAHRGLRQTGRYRHANRPDQVSGLDNRQSCVGGSTGR